MPGIGQALTNNLGPLPVWAWAGLGTAGLAGYLIYRKKQSINAQTAAATNQADSSNLGTVPISNLTTQAEPMPIQMGDTFVQTGAVTSGNATATNPPPANTNANAISAAYNAYASAEQTYLNLEKDKTSSVKSRQTAAANVKSTYAAYAKLAGKPVPTGFLT